MGADVVTQQQIIEEKIINKYFIIRIHSKQPKKSPIPIGTKMWKLIVATASMYVV